MRVAPKADAAAVRPPKADTVKKKVKADKRQRERERYAARTKEKQMLPSLGEKQMLPSKTAELTAQVEAESKLVAEMLAPLADNDFGLQGPNGRVQGGGRRRRNRANCAKPSRTRV